MMDSTDDNGIADLKEASVMAEYSLFKEAACELQQVDMAPMDDATKIAFGVNVYNLMIRFAAIEVGVATTKLTRSQFYSETHFNIGGNLYSFQDWEHGILRGNKKAPYTLSLPFGRHDPRLKFIVQKPDPRIHFALNCGAKSCPPILMLSAEGLDKELEIQAAYFCGLDTNCEIQANKKTVKLSKIFQWYRTDFECPVAKLPHAVSNYVKGPKRQKLKKLLKM